MCRVSHNLFKCVYSACSCFFQRFWFWEFWLGFLIGSAQSMVDKTAKLLSSCVHSTIFANLYFQPILITSASICVFNYIELRVAVQDRLGLRGNV